MSSFRPAAIIFDFDGVIADSELPSNHALAESLSAIGLPTTFDDCLKDYCGHNWRETQRRIEARLGTALPATFHEDHLVRSQRWFKKGLSAVTGASEYLDATVHLPRAIASSSTKEFICAALDHFEFTPHFRGHIYSAADMERGKPKPDIYLRAAEGLRVDPKRCLAIEDSPTGASAAVAAGMHVVGLLAAGHIADYDAHAASLRSAGVHRVVFAFNEI